jgi:hypothetical protein
MEYNEHKETSKKTDNYKYLSGIFLISTMFVVFTLLITSLLILNSIAPNLISSFNSPVAGAPVPIGTLLTFDTNRVVEGTAISHVPGSSDFVINEAGTYIVSFNASAFEPPIPGVAAILTVSLQQNGTDVPSVSAGQTVAAPFQLVNLSFSAIINANAGDVLTVINNSATEIEVLQPNINIIKL